jgi:hypothetical protein
LKLEHFALLVFTLGCRKEPPPPMPVPAVSIQQPVQPAAPAHVELAVPPDEGTFDADTQVLTTHAAAAAPPGTPEAERERVAGELAAQKAQDRMRQHLQRLTGNSPHGMEAEILIKHARETHRRVFDGGVEVTLTLNLLEADKDIPH